MDPIKEAFLRIKEDITDLKQELDSLKSSLKDFIDSEKEKSRKETSQSHKSPHLDNQTDIQTNRQAIQPLEELYTQNMGFSIGNNGVQTNKPTDLQTNQQTLFVEEKRSLSDFKKAREILSSLDSIKKEIYYKFKALTPQEMMVFSTIYSLDEQGFTDITYNSLSKLLNLSESSLRDYTNKLIKKGIPLKKTKQNNKVVFLKIPDELKNIASLEVIMKLRDL